MNERAEESRTSESKERPPREISTRTLAGLLEQHRQWLGSDRKQGASADLSGADLQGADLSGADLVEANLQQAVLREANLKRAVLIEANLQQAALSGADLQGADLNRANLHGADLSGADLSGANLQTADLSGANLKRAVLSEANLQQAALSEAKLQQAVLRGANLQRAVLIEAKLQGADLSGANLQGADLSGAYLQKADLLKANLQGANLYRAQLSHATFLNTNLREANLQNATLEDVSGLLARQLAGADVSGAKLPPDIHKFEGLAIVEEASKNTRKIFLAMLLGSAYSALTVFSTKDAALLTNSASSPLPIIGTPIPIAGFFGVAPVILFAIYLYFHFYLQRLWEALADLPAGLPDGRPLDKRAYPWLLNGLVRSHFLQLKEDRPPLSRLQALVSTLLAWWAVPFTIALFWLRYLPRHEWVGTGFHLAFLVLAIVCAVWFQRLARITLRGQLPTPIRFEGNWRRAKPYKQALKKTYKLVVISGVVLLFAVGVSYGAINGTPRWQATGAGAVMTRLRKTIPQILPIVGARAFADISGQEVSTKPPNWFRDGELPRLVKGARLEYADLRNAYASSAFLVNANLGLANLQGADLRLANLQGADLGGANLQGVTLGRANLQGADLRLANLQRAFLVWANLQGADLSAAKLQGADLSGANLQGATLGRANLQGADLGGANLQGTVGLTAIQAKAANNWDSAFYSDDFLTELGLPSDHNQMLCIQFEGLAPALCRDFVDQP